MTVALALDDVRDVLKTSSPVEEEVVE